MAEKYITHLDGIPKDKFTISDCGVIMNKYKNETVSTRVDKRGNGYIITTLTDKGVMKTIRLDYLVLYYFKDCHGFEPWNPLLSVEYRDGNLMNISPNNLVLCLRNTNIPVLDVHIIAFMMSNGVWDNEEISKYLGYFISENVIKRLGYTGSICSGKSYRLSKLFGYDLKQVREKYPYKITPPRFLSENEIRKICETLITEGPDVEYVFTSLTDEIPNMSRSHINAIINKRKFTNISDEYFKSPLTIERGENDPPILKAYPDLTNETWKRIEDIEGYYVSDKGRVRNKYGRILKPGPYGKIAFRVTNASSSKTIIARNIARLVMCAFGIDLPKMLNLPQNKFNVDHKDGNEENNYPENLVWVPTGSSLKRGCYTVTEVEQIFQILKKCDNREDIKRRILTEIEHNTPLARISSIVLGHKYAYLLQNREDVKWVPLIEISGVKTKYEISNAGTIREINSKKYITKHFRFLEERNIVVLDGIERYVDNLVLFSFKPDLLARKDRGHRTVHLNGDLLDDTLSNLDYIKKEYSKKYATTTLIQMKHKYGIDEIWKPITSKGITMSISNYGRIKHGKNYITPRVLHPQNDPPYSGFHVQDKGRRCNFITRNLVYTAFIGEIPSNNRVFVMDGDENNCHVCNLKLGQSKSITNAADRMKRVGKINVETNTCVVFENVFEAAADAGTTEDAMRRRIYHKTKKNGYYWEYV